MLKYEHATTHGDLFTAGRYDSTYDTHDPDIEPSDPVPPEGDGWEFVNGTASNHRLYFFWRRKVVSKKSTTG